MAEDQLDSITSLAELRSKIEKWRETRRPGSRMPLELWTSAAEYARRDGPSRIAQALGLDYSKLKRLANESVTQLAASVDLPRFVEVSISPPSRSVCSVDLERPDGARMRVRDVETSAVLPLCRVFWEFAG